MKWKNHKYTKVSNGEYFYDYMQDAEKEKTKGKDALEKYRYYDNENKMYNLKRVEKDGKVEYVRSQQKDASIYDNKKDSKKYLKDYSEWVRNGQKGPRPTPPKAISKAQRDSYKKDAKNSQKKVVEYRKKAIKSIPRSVVHQGKIATSNAIRKARFQHSYRKATRSQNK